MLGLVDQRSTADSNREEGFPEPIAKYILYLKHLYPPIHYREIVRIIGNKFGHKTDHKKVQRFLERHAIPVQLELEITHFHDFEDAYEARWTVVRMFYEGWNKKSIAAVLKLARSHVTTLIQAFEKDGFEGLEDKRTRPATHPDNQLTLPFMDRVFRAQLEYPDAGRFRLHGILEQEMGDDLPSERTVGRAMANNRFWRGAPDPLGQEHESTDKEPAELPYKPFYHHQYWFIDIRYLVRFEGKWVYSICIIEGLSRTMLAGMASRYQDELAILQLLHAAFGDYGLPWGIVSDNGSVFTAEAFLRVLDGVRPDIVYWDANVRRIRLASWDPFAGSWNFTINLAGPPPGQGSGYLSAARLSDGRIAVSYFLLLPSLEGGSGQLRLATWDGQSWSDTFIAFGLDETAPYNALAVDAVENEPAVAYYLQSTGQIIYAFRQGTVWQSQTAASDVTGVTGLALQLALDSHRQPRIAYAAADSLWLASGQEDTWRTEPVYEETGVTLNSVSLGLGHRQHIALGTSSGWRYVSTLAASSGPEPLILTPYDPVSPWLACFDFLFDDDDLVPTGAAPLRVPAGGDLDDLGIFLAMTPLFQATPGGQNYVSLYGDHVQEMTGIILDDTTLLWDSFGTLQNFLPGLEALVSGEGSEVVVTQQMVDDALDIWQRLAAAGSPELAATINGQLAQYNNLQDFAGMTFDEWAAAIGVSPPDEAVYLPLIVRP
jgi:transposase